MSKCGVQRGRDIGRIQKGFLGEGSGRARCRIVEEFSLLSASRDTSSCGVVFGCFDSFNSLLCCIPF